MTATNSRPIDMAAFMTWIASFPRKFEASDVTRQPRLYRAAIEYARSYEGSFAYMVEMKDAALRFNSLSMGQAKGVLNCARAEAQRTARRESLAVPAPTKAKRGVEVEPMAVHDARFQAMLDREAGNRNQFTTEANRTFDRVVIVRKFDGAEMSTPVDSVTVVGDLIYAVIDGRGTNSPVASRADIERGTVAIRYANGSPYLATYDAAALFGERTATIPGYAEAQAAIEASRSEPSAADRAASAAFAVAGRLAPQTPDIDFVSDDVLYAFGGAARADALAEERAEREEEAAKPDWAVQEAANRARAAKPSLAGIENATYTVVFDGDEEDRITIKISDPTWANDAAGKQQVSYLFGPDNETNFKGVGFVSGGEFRPWKSFSETASREFRDRIEDALLAIASGERDELRLAYALRSGRCAACGRKLTVPASINRGLGPECAKRF
jgi:hypothetical protein